MDTFRKWLNKPKADDKSLLARFYHADRALTAVASELDSFDGRAEPDRCSRLVSRLRQGQDKVLSITNQIMEELLGDDRAPRAFRAKFPEEVLQENLAGQLWFGAECLAAGSSIMNRELESTAMRPLAKAVTKSLDNVRNLLRDQCLRNNIPNSPTLRLDINDAATEQLYESLKIFDRLFAEFELRYVSAMVQVKSKHEYEMQELICVLFSETLQRALRIGLLDQDQVDSYDPALMFSIPRLAIITGLVVYNKGPLNMDMPADQLSEMFRPFRTILIKIRDLLRTLNKNELFQLEKLLCTNEDIHLKSINKSTTTSMTTTTTTATTTTTTTINTTSNEKINCDDEHDDKSNSDEELVSNLVDNNNSTTNGEIYNGVSGPDDVVSTTPSTFSTTSSLSSTSSSTTSESSFDWTDDDKSNKDEKENLVTTDCASGYLIPNTNFGNLLQTNETLLTDSFIASDDEYDPDDGHRLRNNDNNNVNIDSDINTENTCSNQVSDSNNAVKEMNENSCRSPIKNYSEDRTNDTNCSSINNDNKMNNGDNKNAIKPSCSRMETTDSSEDSEQQTIKASKSTDSDFCESSDHNHRHQKLNKNSSKSSSKSSQRHHHNHRHHSKKRSKHSDSSNNSQSNGTSNEDTSTSSSLSDGDPHEVALALRAAGRMKFKSTENLLHRLFVCIAGVADQLQTNFASDLRQILRSVFLINTTPPQDEIKIPEKSKDTSDLFEFRASENDVIQQNAGSNQSIYSAEEVNPEIDNVFSESHTVRTITQRGNSLDNDIRTVRNNIGRSRSLGEETHENGNNLSFSRDRRSSHGSQSESNSPVNSSASNSPVGDHRTTSSTNNINSNCYNRRGVGGGGGGGGRKINTAVNTNNIVTSTTTTTNNINNTTTNTLSSLSSSPRQSPPAWIPDEEAPRCMACTIPFTAFRRRHHCRNCGGVFCGGCSNSSAPLPKYGLIKAVRVCRDCYIREVGT